MRPFFLLFIGLLISLNMKGEPLGLAQKEAIAQLDIALENKEAYSKKRAQSITVLRQLLTAEPLTSEEEYRIQDKLAASYQTYKIDSALYYRLKNAQISKDRPRNIDAQIALAQAYILSGITQEAQAILNNIEIKSLNKGQKTAFFSANLALYNYLQAYFENAPINFNYQNKIIENQDSLLKYLSKEDVIFPVIQAEKLMQYSFG